MATVLSPSQIERCGARLLGHRFLPGLPRRWQQRRAIARLARDGSSASVRALAVALVRRLPGEPTTREALDSAVAALRHPAQLGVIAEVACQHWPDPGAAPLIALLQREGFLPLDPPDQRVAVALACGWPERLAEDGPTILPPLLVAWGRAATTTAAAAALRQLRRQTTINVLCRHWINAGLAWADMADLRERLGSFLEPSEPTELAWFHPPSDPTGEPAAAAQATKSSLFAMMQSLLDDFAAIIRPRIAAVERLRELSELLVSAGHAPSDPVERVMFCILRHHPEGLADEGPACVPPLVELWNGPSTRAQARQAFQALRSPAAIDALCRHWIDGGEAGDDLAELLLEVGHAPSDLAERALFWLLIGQPERYRRLDDDGTLLARAQFSVGATVRQRLAAASALTGQTAWLRVMRRSQLLETFTVDDWASTVQALVRVGEAEPLWSWAIQAPPLHSCTLLRALPAGAEPPPFFGAGARALRDLAHQLPPVPADDWDGLAEHGTRTLKQRTRVARVAWSPDGRWLATGCSDRTIQLLDPASGACVHTLHGYHHRTSGDTTSTGSIGEVLAWSPDGSCLAACSEQTIRVWEAASGTCLLTLQDPGSGDVSSIAWSPDGSRLASLGNGLIHLWEASSGACTLLNPEVLCASGRSLAWSWDGQTIACLSGVTPCLLDVPSGALTVLGAVVQRNADAHGVSAFAWQPRGHGLALASGRTVRLWDRASHTLSHTLDGHTGTIRGLAWSPDGRRLASCGGDQTIRLWNPVSGSCDHILAGHGSWILALTWSADGRWLASTSHDATIRIWNPANGRCTHQLSCQGRSVSWLSWSPDGRCLASAGSETVGLWSRFHHDLAEVLRTPLVQFHPHHWELVRELACDSAPPGEWVAAWLRFVGALGAIVRRFDVAVEEAAPAAADSPYAVLIDG